MGRPYKMELEQIPSTLTHVEALPVAPLLRMLGPTLASHILAIGSGGSLVVARLAGMLHQHATGRLSSAITPLEAAEGDVPLNAAALLLSAGGRNADILTAADAVLRKPYDRVVAVCATTGTPLAARLARAGSPTFELSLPGPKDGFLGTNSLAGNAYMLSRVYQAISGAMVLSSVELSHAAEDLLSTVDEEVLAECLRRPTLQVLARGWTAVAGHDLETRFSEAALGNVVVTDHRNFGHGRHLWLHQRTDTTGVISLELPEDGATAGRVLQHIPQAVPMVRIRATQSGPSGCLQLLLTTMVLAGRAGLISDIDPGRPRVPNFGRKMYGGRPAGRRLPDARERAVNLKVRALGGHRSSAELVDTAFDDFVASLAGETFGSVVLDYDGTLCPDESREDGRLPDSVVAELHRLLRSGLRLGVASGRGDSILPILRSSIAIELWPLVIVGMHNGNDVFALQDVGANHASEQSPTDPTAIRLAADVIRWVTTALGLTLRESDSQVSVRTEEPRDLGTLWWAISEQLHAHHLPLQVVVSTHSIDIIPQSSPGKEIVAAYLRERTGCEVLCIGDRGALPGNDYDLLRSSSSLSVDTVSSRLDSCWRITPDGERGVAATVAYLRALECDGNRARLIIERLLGHG